MFFTTETILHPKVSENIFLEELQGEPVATQFLAERAIGFPTFTYFRWGELGGMTPLSAEGSVTPISSTEYTEHVAKTLEYREGEIITEQAIKWLSNVRDIQADAARHLARRMVLRQEYNTINALIANAGSTMDLSTTSGAAWNEPNADPLDDFTEAKRIVRKEGHTNPDTVLFNADVEADLLQSAIFKQYFMGGTLAQSQINEGSLEGATIRGLKIFTTDAFYLKDSSGNPRSRAAWANEQRGYLIGNTVIVFKRGGDLGYTYVSEPYTVKNFLLEDTRSMKMMGYKTMIPVVYRPQFICTITGVRSESA